MSGAKSENTGQNYEYLETLLAESQVFDDDIECWTDAGRLQLKSKVQAGEDRFNACKNFIEDWFNLCTNLAEKQESVWLLVRQPNIVSLV